MTAMQYAVLFRIECLHRYFGGGPCPSLALSPTEDCRGMLARYRMLVRDTVGGGIVYGPQQSPPDWLRSFDESAPFTFSLTSKDPALDTYTEFNRNGTVDPSTAQPPPADPSLVDPSLVDPSESLFYFDNASDQTAEVFGSRRQLLHPAGKPFAGAAVSVKPKIFNFSPQASSSSGNLQVLEPLSRRVLWQAPVQNGGHSGAPFLLDLRRLPEGRYTLATNEKELQKIYLSDRPAAQQWGAVSIYVGSVQSANLPANCQVLDNHGGVSPKTFTIALDSRKTIWRYYVIDPAAKQDFGHYELTVAGKRPAPPDNSANGDIRFGQPETALVDGRTAWVFESQSPLPLLQSPASEFSLTLRPNGNGKRGDRTIRLPYAQAGSLAKTKKSGQQPLCSEVFVYV